MCEAPPPGVNSMCAENVFATFPEVANLCPIVIYNQKVADHRTIFPSSNPSGRIENLRRNMKATTNSGEENIEVTISKRELVIIEQALSEICYTYDLSDEDCQNRLNAPRVEVEALLEQISSLVGSNSQ